MRKILLSIGLLLCIGSVGHAEDLYFGQSASGGNTGADCANQFAVTFFNTAGNWGAGAGKISPGDTAHLCGTVSTAIAFQGSGTAGNFITLKFESGAKLSGPFSPRWLDTTGASYIVIDGGTPCGVVNGVVSSCSANLTGTGIIENTANGTGLANSTASGGIGTDSACGNDIEVKNILVINIFIATGGTYDPDSEGGNIYFGNNCGDNIYIHDSTVTYADENLSINSAGASPNNWQIYNNRIHHGHWGLKMTMGSGSGVATNWLAYGNDINLSNDWSSVGGPHLDPIMIYGNSGTSYASGIYVYNNHLHGVWTWPGSGECASGGMWINGWLRNIYVFNNVVDTGPDGSTCNGAIAPGAYDQNVLIANNTLLNSSSIGIGDPYGNVTGATSIYSNIIYNIPKPLDCMVDRTDIYDIDHNNYYLYNTIQPGPTPFNCGQGFGEDFNTGTYQWTAQMACGTAMLQCDGNGSNGNPNLAGSYPFTIGAGSAAIGLGKNLYSTCNGQPNPGLGALCFDKNGTARPSSGAWDAGAYQFAAGGSPAPPHHLTVIIN